jgi:translocation and assembly module TamA
MLRDEIWIAGLEGDYLLSEGSHARAYVRFRRVHTYEIEPNPFLPIDTTLDTTTIGGQYILDQLDDPFDPRSGYYLATDLSWTSAYFGSDIDTVRTLTTGSLVTEPLPGWTWSQSLRLGAAKALAGTNLDREMRFMAGGEASIRGFDRDSVGPYLEDDDGLIQVPLGGGALLILNEELRIPVWGQARLAVFVDAGQVWESWSTVDGELAVGAGLGVRILTPIGPVWADVAWPVVNRGISEPGPKYSIGIGRPF